MKLLLLLLLLLALYFDSAYRIIPNYITISFILLGLCLAMLTGYNLFIISLINTMVGFCILLIPYVLGGVGGGDVKLLAAIGSLTNAGFLLNTTFWGLIVAGVISAVILIKKGRLFSTLKFKNCKQDKTPIYIPLGSCFSAVGILLLLL